MSQTTGKMKSVEGGDKTERDKQKSCHVDVQTEYGLARLFFTAELEKLTDVKLKREGQDKFEPVQDLQVTASERDELWFYKVQFRDGVSTGHTHICCAWDDDERVCW